MFIFLIFQQGLETCPTGVCDSTGEPKSWEWISNFPMTRSVRQLGGRSVVDPSDWVNFLKLRKKLHFQHSFIGAPNHFYSCFLGCKEVYQGWFPRIQLSTGYLPLGSFPESQFPRRYFPRRKVSNKDGFPGGKFPKRQFSRRQVPTGVFYFWIFSKFFVLWNLTLGWVR